MKNVIALLGVVAIGLSACHHAPPPPPPPPPPAPAPPPPPPPPPPAPPKCEALAEGCVGAAVARIRRSGFGIGVPAGWAYAQQDDATVIAHDESIVAVTTFGGWPDVKTMDVNRQHAFEALVNLLGVSPPRNPVAWAHPSAKRKTAGPEVSLWQADNVTKGMKKGPVLVFGAELPDHTWLLGAGFVPDDDKSDADKTIVGAIESLAPSPAAAP